MMGKSICAGIAISIGCMANLMSQDRLVGAVLFGVGLLAVCVHGLQLYTGTVCRAEGTLASITDNMLILYGNAVGVLMAAGIFLAAGIDTNVGSIVAAKMEETWLEFFARAMLCNILICIAVDEWQEQKNALLVLLAVTVFVFCGFEHCVANLFYMMADYHVDLGFFALNVLGNATGGILFWRCKCWGSKRGRRKRWRIKYY